MPWERITIGVPDEALKEAVIGEFSGDGIVGVWERPLENGAELVLYFEHGALPPLLDARIGRIFERNGYSIPSVAHGVEQKADWTGEWRKAFTSFPVGKRFQVVPSWEEPAVAAGVENGVPRIVLGIDPGMAFGTGTHETTRTALELLEKLDTVDAAVLDVGAGSGILAIAARKLGLDPVIGCDVDADAVRVARTNVARNSTDAPVFIGSVDAIRSGSVGLVLANLTVDVIIQILPEVARVLEPRGKAILSGILVCHADRLRELLAQACCVVESETICGEWITIQVRRHGD